MQQKITAEIRNFFFIDIFEFLHAKNRFKNRSLGDFALWVKKKLTEGVEYITFTVSLNKLARPGSMTLPPQAGGDNIYRGDRAYRGDRYYRIKENMRWLLEKRS